METHLLCSFIKQYECLSFALLLLLSQRLLDIRLSLCEQMRGNAGMLHSLVRLDILQRVPDEVPQWLHCLLVLLVRWKQNAVNVLHLDYLQRIHSNSLGHYHSLYYWPSFRVCQTGEVLGRVDEGECVDVPSILQWDDELIIKSLKHPVMHVHFLQAYISASYRFMPPFFYQHLRQVSSYFCDLYSLYFKLCSVFAL